jgi:hypothetical protein
MVDFLNGFYTPQQYGQFSFEYLGEMGYLLGMKAPGEIVGAVAGNDDEEDDE